MATALDNDEMPVINVTSAAGATPVAYDIVFNTTAMAPLQQMNLEGLNLPAEILTGIRTLSYDRATKVVIKFKTPWWFWNAEKSVIWGGIEQLSSGRDAHKLARPELHRRQADSQRSYSQAVHPEPRDTLEKTDLKPSVDFLMS